jgi:hypothetical protein
MPYPFAKYAKDGHGASVDGQERNSGVCFDCYDAETRPHRMDLFLWKRSELPRKMDMSRNIS